MKLLILQPTGTRGGTLFGKWVARARGSLGYKSSQVKSRLPAFSRTCQRRDTLLTDCTDLSLSNVVRSVSQRLMDGPVRATVCQSLILAGLKTDHFHESFPSRRISVSTDRTILRDFLTHFLRSPLFLQRAQCSHCKRCISYSNSVCLSVCPSVRLSVRSSHAGIVSKRRHVARCSLHRWIAKCV